MRCQVNFFGKEKQVDSQTVTQSKQSAQSVQHPHGSTNPRPTLEELEQSRPLRGAGAPGRTRSHYDRILALLKERGERGILSSELYDTPHLYGRSPRNRISEIRQAGHLIKTVPMGHAVVRYVLLHENPSPTRRPAQRKEAERKDRPRLTGLELFDAAVS
jgi:hypothetical protein